MLCAQSTSGKIEFGDYLKAILLVFHPENSELEPVLGAHTPSGNAVVSA